MQYSFVNGQTAAELIYERADSDKPHMGLTTWAAAPYGKIVKSDVSIVKKYLRYVHIYYSASKAAGERARLEEKYSGDAKLSIK